MLIKYSLLFMLISLVEEIRCAGGRVSISPDEKHSKTMRKVADFATKEIHYKKLHQGEYNKCTKLDNEIISAEKQVVAGSLYTLQLKIKPVSVNSEKCQGKTSQDNWKPELCETEILWQAWKEPQMELRRAVCLKIED